jgi:hypothetical protein
MSRETKESDHRFAVALRISFLNDLHKGVL